MITFWKMNLVAGVAYCMSMVGTACGSPCDLNSALSAKLGPKAKHTWPHKLKAPTPTTLIS